MNAPASTTRNSAVRLVRGMRCRPQRLGAASILLCQDRDQNYRRSDKENDGQPQQYLRYQVGHQPPLGKLSYSEISERFQLKHLRAEFPGSAIYRAISFAPAGCVFADPTPTAAE